MLKVLLLFSAPIADLIVITDHDDGIFVTQVAFIAGDFDAALL